MSFMNWFGVIVCVALFSCTAKVGAEHTDKPEDEQTNEKPVWKIENGKFYRDGEWVFLKIAKPLRNFADGNAVQQLINDLDKLKSKHYNVIRSIVIGIILITMATVFPTCRWSH